MTVRARELLGAPGSLTGAPDDVAWLTQPQGAFQARDGSEVTWRREDGASPCLRIVVAPVRPGHNVTLDLRVDGGPVIEVPASPEWRAPAAGERVFKAPLPRTGAVEALPVLRFAGQPISPRLNQTTAAAPAPGPDSAPAWNWSTKYVASFSARARSQVVGEGPDGLRIDWLIEDGHFRGPDIDAVVMPGAVDFMRIRRDGVAIVDVRACLQTSAGARLYAAYGGCVDLGTDGYARALRGQFAPLPPLVVTPTFETGDARLQWLNRVRCVGVGRVDTSSRTYAFDVHAVAVGGAVSS